MRKALTLFLSVVCGLVVLAAPALAVEADEVAAAAANDGFYVESGSSISEQQAGELVAELRNAGENFVLVVLSDEPPAGATTFADNVFFALGRGLIFVIAPDSLGFAGEGEFYDEFELEQALEAAANSLGTDFDLAATFVSELTGVPVAIPTGPVPVPTTVAASIPTTQAPAANDGGSNAFLWILLLAGGGLLIWWLIRRSKAAAQGAPADDPNLSKARYLIEEQLNDVANDILSMEDEVKVADNDRASTFYQEASQTYNDVTEELAQTDTASGLLDLSNKLDVAIWQLDSAEAILDDKPMPPRPEAKRLEAPPPTAPPPRTTVPGPASYERRPTRRSSIGGGGLMDLLIMVGGAVANNRRRATTRPSSGGGVGGGLGDLFRRKSQPAQRQPTITPPPSSSSGPRSNPVPGPGRPATPSPTRTPVPGTRTRKGTAGRVRSGRKRRKG